MRLAEKLRTSHVKRWHIVRVAREQTIAEHMYLVWVLVTELCERMNMGPEFTFAAQQLALLHDQPEVIFGDLPTPSKIKMRENGVNFEELEEESLPILGSLWRHIEESHPAVVYAVKLMDLTESIRFLHVEHLDKHGASVIGYLHGLFAQTMNRARFKHAILPWEHAQAVLTEAIEGVVR